MALSTRLDLQDLALRDMRRRSYRAKWTTLKLPRELALKLLHHLDYSGKPISDEDCDKIVESLKKSTHLE